MHVWTSEWDEVNNTRKTVCGRFRKSYQSSRGEKQSRKLLEQAGYIASGTETFGAASE